MTTIPYLPARLPGWVKNDFVQAAVIAVSITALTYLLAYSAGWVSGDPNWLEIIASGMNYAATFLSIKQRRFFYLIGIGASAIYAVVYGQVGLLASGVLSLYLTISLIYGYFRWGKDKKSRPVHNVQLKWVPVYLLVTAAFYGGAYLTVTLLGGEFALWDASILVLTILAQFLLDNKVIQTWAVWTLVNIVGVVLYYTSGLYFAAIQQLLFGIANLWGFLAWRKSMPGKTDADESLRRAIQESKDRHPAGKELSNER
jgi:nicotinamide mononucleotide transporter